MSALWGLLESGYDLGQVTPALAGCDAIYLAQVAFVCWVGGHLITRGELLGK